MTVVNPVIAAVVGLTMFGEQFRHGTAGTMLAPACAVLAAGGLILLTTERLGAEHRAAQAADDGLPDARADGEPVGMGHDDVEHEDVAATEAAPGPSAPGGTAEAARGTFSAVRRPMPVLMPLECLGRVVFGPGMSRYTGPAG